MTIVWNIQFKRMFMIIAGILLFVGCVPERKIGNEYLSQLGKTTLVITTPEWVKMVNLSADSTEEDSGLSPREKDSIRFYKSVILQNISDSVLIRNYINGLRNNFKIQGYKTIIASRYDSVYPVKGNAYLINIGQIELDEQNIPTRDETKYNNKLFAADYDISEIELSYWIEVSKIVDGIAVKPSRLLYDSFDKTEESQGYFDWNAKDKKMYYYLTREKLTPGFIDTLANSLGANHAVRLNEFLLNEYISNKLPQKTNRILFGVNQKVGTIQRIYETPFKEIHE